MPKVTKQKMTAKIVLTVEIEFTSESKEETELCRDEIINNLELSAQSLIPLSDPDGEDALEPEHVGIDVKELTWKQVKVRRAIKRVK